MLRPSLCNYSDAYILAKGPATIKNRWCQYIDEVMPIYNLIL